MSITRVALGPLSLAVSLGVALPVAGSEPGPGGCAAVQGNLIEQVVDARLSTFDPFGRVVNFSDGDIVSVGTAILTSVGPGPTPGTLAATARRLFILNPSDQIFATDSVVFTPIPGTSDVDDVVTITISGGLGRFEKATGQIVATGRGFDFFPLPPGPVAGRSYFAFSYVGQVCVP